MNTVDIKGTEFLVMSTYELNETKEDSYEAGKIAQCAESQMIENHNINNGIDKGLKRISEDEIYKLGMADAQHHDTIVMAVLMVVSAIIGVLLGLCIR